MSFTSAAFACFLILTIVIYYLFPRKNYQWIVLLVASYVFYLWADIRFLFYIVFTTVTTYLATRKITQINLATKAFIKENKNSLTREDRTAYKAKAKRKTRNWTTLCLLLNFGILFFIKYFNYLSYIASRVFNLSSVSLNLLIPLGISFYTFQSMSYVIDVYREDTEAEQNIAKLALFISFFPQILQGPISSYNQLAHQLYEPHRCEYRRIKYGLELMLWGFFKKLVIADRAAAAIQAVTNSPYEFNGTVLTFTVLLYALQLYADFSAGIDIIRAIAQMLGIDMIQNFRQPYFATSLNDYWNRWHISLGAWMKSYIFYPIALSKGANRFTKAVKNSFFGKSKVGAYLAVVLPGTIASLIVFLVVGIWHGAGSKYILFGIYNGIIIMLSTLFKPCFEWVNRFLHINVKSFAHHAFQIVRTFILVCIGNITDLIWSARDFLPWLRKIITEQNFIAAKEQIGNNISLCKPDYILLILCTLLMFAVGVLRENNPSIPLRTIFEREGTFTQWILIVSCIIVILIFGIYGPGVQASEFAYAQF